MPAHKQYVLLHAMRLMMISFFIFIAGCSSHAINTLNATTESELISAMGPPDSIVNTPDGKRVLTWKRRWTGVWWTRHECRQSVTVGKDGKVETSASDDCVG